MKSRQAYFLRQWLWEFHHWRRNQVYRLKYLKYNVNLQWTVSKVRRRRGIAFLPGTSVQSTPETTVRTEHRFMSIKHLRHIPTGPPFSVALNTLLLVNLPRRGLAIADDHSDIFLLHCALSCDISFSSMYSQPVHSSMSCIHCLLGLPWCRSSSMIPSRTVSANWP